MRLLPTLALASAVMLGACQNPDGTTNVPQSLALGAGVLLAGVALVAVAGNSDSNDSRQYRRGHDRYGYGGRYDDRRGTGYRRW